MFPACRGLSKAYVASVFLPGRPICDTLIIFIKLYITRRSMKNPLDSIAGTIVSGLVLTIVLYVFLKNFILVGG